ncbi:MAG: SRPBCC family protein [Pedobacter sp.]|nr:SRPBCC family protein [Pedobacter sp.]
MEPLEKITVEVIVAAPIEKVWEYWTSPAHLTKWVFASGDWHAPYAENELMIDGRFKTRMEAKDGSAGFDFEGVYTNIEHHRLIEYKLGDEREVEIEFLDNGTQVHIIETFDAETVNPIAMQKNGWQAILDNFKKYVERSL